MKNYITTLLEEKNIDNQDTVTIEDNYSTHIYTYEQIIEDVESITNGNVMLKDKIKATFVKIDFMGGDVTDYLRHLAGILVMTAQNV